MAVSRPANPPTEPRQRDPSRERPHLLLALGLVALGVLYTAIVLRFAPTAFVGDESNYHGLAANLIHGYFSPPGQVQLWWGPGYPLFLAPFVAAGLSSMALRLLNVVLALATVYLTYRIARAYLRLAGAVLVAAYVGLYPPMLQLLPRLLSEWLAALLIVGWTLAFCQLHRTRSQATPWIVLAAALLAYLAITKILFGYVILVALIASIVILLVTRARIFRRWVAVYALALVFCLPYLAYTYALTGHVFYWGTSGGLQLYWMATPFAGEVGDWHSFEETAANPRLDDAHRAFFDQVENLPEVERDDALRKRALQNIVEHPLKFAANWVDNVGRLILDYPYSFSSPGRAALANGLVHLPLLVMVIAAIVGAVRARRWPRVELVGTAMFVAIAFVGSSLVSAYVRQFAVLVPSILLVASACLSDGPRLPLWSSLLIRLETTFQRRTPLERTPT